MFNHHSKFLMYMALCASLLINFEQFVGLALGIDDYDYTWLFEVSDSVDLRVTRRPEFVLQFCCIVLHTLI